MPHLQCSLACARQRSVDYTACVPSVLGGEAAYSADLELFQWCFSPTALLLNGFGPRSAQLLFSFTRLSKQWRVVPRCPLDIRLKGVRVQLLNALLWAEGARLQCSQNLIQQIREIVQERAERPTAVQQVRDRTKQVAQEVARSRHRRDIEYDLVQMNH
jgi:hypothetical protein